MKTLKTYLNEAIYTLIKNLNVEYTVIPSNGKLVSTAKDYTEARTADCVLHRGGIAQQASATNVLKPSKKYELNIPMTLKKYPSCFGYI